MHLRSTAFPDGGAIPIQYTQDGEDISPPLSWTEVPPGTRSLALIVEDPDAPDPAKPERVWVHWVVADLPPDSKGLPERVTALGRGHIGRNDWNHTSWDGPAPPRGRHRYLFRLYALDRELGLVHPSKAELQRAMANANVLAEAVLTGTYQRAKA